jgi:hypothetical protein
MPVYIYLFLLKFEEMSFDVEKSEEDALNSNIEYDTHVSL